MLIQYIRWFKGYLRIQLIGYSPERFLNICKNKNILIWNLKSEENQYELYILLKDFRKLKPLCKKTGTKIRILEKIGFPFVLSHLKRRKIFIIGLFFSLIAIYVSSFHIWSIDVTGNQKLTQDVVCTYLKEKEIHIGTSKNQLNCKNIAVDMRKEFADIIWVSVSLDGTKLIIEIKENPNTKESDIENSVSGDIVSEYDCIITSIITRNGVPQVKVGDSVKKGDILVSGNVPVLNDNKEVINTKFVKADADVFGKIRINYQNKIDKNYKNKKYNKEFLYWNIGPWKRTNKKNQEIFMVNNYLNIGKVKEYEWFHSSYSETEREEILENNYQKYCNKLKEEKVSILESHFIVSHYNDYSVGVSNLLIEQQIN